MKHVNIPVFIPHLGCPNACVFCNQHVISGKRDFDPEKVIPEIESALATVNPETTDAEIAFFGGSFTGIDRALMLRLLAIAKKYRDAKRVSSIRLSTRPDYIDSERLEILRDYGVGTVELGIQSMDDRVLTAARRGHTSKDSELACHLVREYGFHLVGQMMTGLPAATPESEIFTAERLCSLGCDAARIYPTMVFRGTELETMLTEGRYRTPALSDAVKRTAGAFSVFLRQSVPVIRIGLCAQETLAGENGIISGNYHAAMGELVENEVYRSILEAVFEKIPNSLCKEHLLLYVPSRHISKAVGQKRGNLRYIADRFGAASVRTREDTLLSPYSVRVQTEKRSFFGKI